MPLKKKVEVQTFTIKLLETLPIGDHDVED